VFASLALLWAASRRGLLIVAFLQVISGAAGGALLVLVKNLADAILGAGNSGEFQAVLPWLAATAALTLVTNFSGSTQWELQRLLSELVTRRVAGRIFEVVAVADLETFETPDFHNRLERAWMSGGAHPRQTTPRRAS
jgi:ATP-binding cassette, subfamily B, bacterial